jgi:hypothetical protein
MADTPEHPNDAANEQDFIGGQGGREHADQRSWDAFDWSAWGVDTGAGDGAAGGHDNHDDGASSEMGGDHGGPDTQRRPLRGARPGMLRPPLDDLGDDDDSPEAAADGGRWVTRGGVVQWEESDDRDVTAFPNLRDEAVSSWAEDDVTLPLAAPERLRVRATRAWLARRRLGESDAQGALLLERRRIYGAPADDEQAPDGDQTIPNRRRARHERPDNPLDLAIAEHQAAADEYEDLLLTLEELRAHSGADRTLIEFYLSVTDRLAALAGQPAMPTSYDELTAEEDDNANERTISPADWAGLAALRTDTGADATTIPQTRHAVAPRDRREWMGRVYAALQTRRHAERVSAPEPEE